MTAVKYDLPEKVEAEIIGYAKENGLSKVILFGSRAKCCNTPRSDIDLAVSGGDIDNFSFLLADKADTLLMFDIIDLDKPVSAALADEISKYGVVIYEKIR